MEADNVLTLWVVDLQAPSLNLSFSPSFLHRGTWPSKPNIMTNETFKAFSQILCKLIRKISELHWPTPLHKALLMDGHKTSSFDVKSLEASAHAWLLFQGWKLLTKPGPGWWQDLNICWCLQYLGQTLYFQKKKKKGPNRSHVARRYFITDLIIIIPRQDSELRILHKVKQQKNIAIFLCSISLNLANRGTCSVF